MFRSGYELTTGLTNLLILFSSLYCFIKLRKLNYNKYWLLFYIFLILGGFLGFVIHSFNISNLIVNILWIILLFVFICIIDSLLFTEYKFNKYIVICSILLYLFMIVEIILNKDFIITFVIYVCFNLLLIIISFIKNKKYYYFIPLFFQVIGGLILINRNIKIFYLDHNGIYHLFMVFTIIGFYLCNMKCVK